MSTRLLVALCGAMLMSALGCATTEQRRNERDFSGRPYVLAMGCQLAEAPQFTVVVSMDKDQIVDGGVIDGPTRRVLHVRRPDRLAVQVVHAQGQRQTWYNGSRLVCLEGTRNAYASLPVTGSVSGMFVSLRRSGHYVRPLAVLCDSDPASALMNQAQNVVYVGRKHLNGRPCNHVRIEREDAVIEMWILDGTPPLLLQTAVRETGQAGPARISRFENWDFHSALSDAQFEPWLPSEAYQVEMTDLTGLP